MKRTLTALTVAVAMFASSASAFDPDDLQTLLDTGECGRCDLSGANLEGANLYGANLGKAYLLNANLGNANLGGANLDGVDLGYANMNGAILCNTIMPDGSVIYSGC